MYKHCNSKNRGGQIYATAVFLMTNSLGCLPTGLKKKKFLSGTINIGDKYLNS